MNYKTPGGDGSAEDGKNNKKKNFKKKTQTEIQLLKTTGDVETEKEQGEITI